MGKLLGHLLYLGLREEPHRILGIVTFCLILSQPFTFLFMVFLLWCYHADYKVWRFYMLRALSSSANCWGISSSPTLTSQIFSLLCNQLLLLQEWKTRSFQLDRKKSQSWRVQNQEIMIWIKQMCDLQIFYYAIFIVFSWVKAKI